MSVMSRRMRSASQRLSLRAAFCPSHTQCHANTLSTTGSKASLLPFSAKRAYSFGHSYSQGDQILDLPEHQQPGLGYRRSPSAQVVGPTPRLSPQRRLILPISADTPAGVYRVADQLAASISEMRASRKQEFEHPAYQQDAAITKLASSLTAAATSHPKPWRSFTTTLTGFPPELPKSDPPSSGHSLLSQCISSPVLVSDNHAQDQAVSFIFPGQGSQWPQMGQKLARAFPVFAQSLHASEAVLSELQREHGGSTSWWLTRELDAPEAITHLARGKADNAAYDIIMPTLTALQIALVDLLASWGVRPASVVGHSLGEVGAAYCSAALSRQSALRVSYFRGRSAAKLTKHPRKGDMMVVSVSVDKLESEYLPALTSGQAWVAGSLPVSGTGGPHLHTTMVSGDTAAVKELGDRLGREDIRCRVLGQMLAWHSPHFDPLLDDYLQCIGDSEGKLDGPLVNDGCSQFSSLTGGLIPADTLRTAAYWGDSLVSPVNFKDAFASLVEHNNNMMNAQVTGQQHVFLEIGPHPVFRQIILSAFETNDDGASNAQMLISNDNSNNNNDDGQRKDLAAAPTQKGDGSGPQRAPQKTDVSYNTMLDSGCDDVEAALEAVGGLWRRGCRVDLDKVNFP